MQLIPDLFHLFSPQIKIGPILSRSQFLCVKGQWNISNSSQPWSCSLLWIKWDPFKLSLWWENCRTMRCRLRQQLNWVWVRWTITLLFSLCISQAIWGLIWKRTVKKSKTITLLFSQRKDGNWWHGFGVPSNFNILEQYFPLEETVHLFLFAFFYSGLFPRKLDWGVIFGKLDGDYLWNIGWGIIFSALDWGLSFEHWIGSYLWQIGWGLSCLWQKCTDRDGGW